MGGLKPEQLTLIIDEYDSLLFEGKPIDVQTTLE